MSLTDVGSIGQLVLGAATLAWSIRAARNSRRTRADSLADKKRYEDLIDALKLAEDNRTARELTRDMDLVAWMQREQRAEGKHGSARIFERDAEAVEAERDRP